MDGLGIPFNGIVLTELNPATGKPYNLNNYHHLANYDCEGASIIYHNGYYYLFFNRYDCCQGVNSNYTVFVGRSPNVTGPYLDKNGNNCVNNGGSVFLSSDGRYIGPGHFGYGENRLTYHFYDANDNGAPKVRTTTLGWSNGWPVAGGTGDDGGNNNGAIVDGGTYRIIPRHAQSKAVEVYNFETGNGGNVVQYEYWGGAPQKWMASDAGNGYWRFTPSNSSVRAMDVTDISSADGANIQIWDYWGGAAQQWSLQEAGDGWYQVISRNSGKCLDVNNASGSDGANVIQWTCNSNLNQQFRFEPVSANREDVSQALENTSFSFYPNPAKDILYISLPPYEGGMHELSLFSVSGKLLLKKELGAGDSRLDISGIPEGIFIVKVRSGASEIIRKIHKQ